MDARPASASEIVLRQLMLPEHANPFGNVHGAWIFKLVDEATGSAAMRHCQLRVVTKLVDQMTFDQPVYVGNLVHVTARITWTGRTSLEVAARVERFRGAGIDRLIVSPVHVERSEQVRTLERLAALAGVGTPA